MDWKQLKKDYLKAIDHDDTLVDANFRKGLDGVKEILDLRFNRQAQSRKDLKALVFINRNESDIRIALSN